jgi:hypothetical protein
MWQKEQRRRYLGIVLLSKRPHFRTRYIKTTYAITTPLRIDAQKVLCCSEKKSDPELISECVKVSEKTNSTPPALYRQGNCYLDLIQFVVRFPAQNRVL